MDLEETWRRASEPEGLCAGGGQAHPLHSLSFLGFCLVWLESSGQIYTPEGQCRWCEWARQRIRGFLETRLLRERKCPLCGYKGLCVLGVHLFKASRGVSLISLLLSGVTAELYIPSCRNVCKEEFLFF